MNKEQKYTSNIVEILLVLSIIAAALALFVRVVVFNKYTYTNILNKNNVYEEIKDSVYEKIDNTLKARNINYDIKAQIITEDDIKREADNAIIGIIEYLKTGENNVKPIDTQIYKQRAADVLHSTIDNVIRPAGNEVSFNDNLKVKNTECNLSKPKFSEMVIAGKDTFKVEKLMTRSEAEARVREILKEKGMTEEQAIEKARQKGITEEQALKILAGYGITIDGEPEENGTKSEATGNNSQSQAAGKSDSSMENNNEAASNSKDEGFIDNKDDKSNKNDQADKSAKSQLAQIENKLLNEANSSIEKEVGKINFNSILESGKFKTLAKITSMVYKLFWLFMILPAIFMAVLVIMNRKKVSYGFKRIGRGFLSAGLILFVIFGSVVAFKVYEKINISPVYFKETASYIIKYCLTVLLTYGIVISAIGSFIFIPAMIKIRK